MIARGRVLALVALSLCAAAGSAAAAVPSWTTYHHDGARSGIDPDSTSPVAPSQVWQTSSLDGDVYAEPLVYGSTVYVATENDTVYALDASTGTILWRMHLATPVPSNKLSCGDISPVVGITSTPVIDPSTNRIYLVADTWNGSAAQHQLFGVNLNNGSVGVGPIDVEPPGSTPLDQLQRAGLALDAGKVIIGYGGNYGDCGSYHGWLVAVPEGGGPMQSFEVDPKTNQGSIWGSGNAPAIDTSGNLWIATGNGSSSSFGYQESVIELDSNLNLLGYWAPSNWSSLDSSDTDLGSSMPLLLPGGLVFEIGKSGVGYLVSATSLGGEGARPAYSASVCSGSWGGGIYENGVIYVACSDGMHALSLNASARTFAPVSGWTVDSSAEGPPIFAGGLVWSAGWGNGVLYGLDPSTGATRFSANLGGFEHFATPSAGGGLLYVANQDKVTAFKIANPPGATPTTTTVAFAANLVPAGRPVSLNATVSPTPDGGTIAFAIDGKAISSCSGKISPSGQASCIVGFATAGRHTVTATYSGDASYGSSSATRTEFVVAPAPVLTRIHATSLRGKLRVTLRSSLAAKLTAVVYRQEAGRVIRRRCRIGAERGKTCRVLLRKLTLRLNARRGGNTFKPRMRPLAPGRYMIYLTAETPAGGRSKRYSITLVVRPG